MPTAHAYLFMDGQPSDSLSDGTESQWRTIAFFLFQSNPSQKAATEGNIPFEQVLGADAAFQNSMALLLEHMGVTALQKWSKGKAASKAQYRRAFGNALPKLIANGIAVNAISFQAATLRN